MPASVSLGIQGKTQTLALSVLLGNSKLRVAMSFVIHVWQANFRLLLRPLQTHANHANCNLSQMQRAAQQVPAAVTLGIQGIQQTLAPSALLGNSKLLVAMSRVVHVGQANFRFKQFYQTQFSKSRFIHFSVEIAKQRISSEHI